MADVNTAHTRYQEYGIRYVIGYTIKHNIECNDYVVATKSQILYSENKDKKEE